MSALGLNIDTHNQLYYAALDYKKIAFCQNADGSWSEGVFKYLKQGSAIRLKEEQGESLKALPPQVLIALAAVRILEKDFSKNKREAKFVVAKGKAFIKKEAKVSDAELEKMIDEVRVDLI